MYVVSVNLVVINTSFLFFVKKVDKMTEYFSIGEGGRCTIVEENEFNLLLRSNRRHLLVRLDNNTFTIFRTKYRNISSMNFTKKQFLRIIKVLMNITD